MNRAISLTGLSVVMAYCLYRWSKTNHTAAAANSNAAQSSNPSTVSTYPGSDGYEPIDNTGQAFSDFFSDAGDLQFSQLPTVSADTITAGAQRPEQILAGLAPTSQHLSPIRGYGIDTTPDTLSPYDEYIGIPEVSEYAVPMRPEQMVAWYPPRLIKPMAVTDPVDVGSGYQPAIDSDQYLGKDKMVWEL